MHTWDEWDEYERMHGDWVDTQREAPTVTAYCSQIGPDGIGHERNGAACLASVLLSEGWEDDPYELTVRIAHDAAIELDLVTPVQLLMAGRKYGLPGDSWTAWSDALEAHDRGEAVLCAVNNRYLIPRTYPPGERWSGTHWIRVLGELDGGAMTYTYDPMTYCPQPPGWVYRGPTVYTTASVRAAISKSEFGEAGIILRSPSGRRLNG